MADKSGEDILLVPSAILVPHELQLDVGSVPSGMVPLQGRPILERIAEAYEDLGVTRAVVVNQAGDAIRRHTARSEYDWDIVDISQSGSLAETVRRGLDAYRSDLEDRRLYLNFADTLVSPIRPLEKTDYVAYQRAPRAYRWTTIKIEDGTIDTIVPKYEQTSSDPQPVFTGQFGFTDPEALRQELVSTVSESDGALPPFYRALLRYLRSRNYELYEPDEWLDVGHLDTYHRAKKQYLNTRQFNELNVDTKNVLTKRSDDETTLINEITWYTQIPTQLQPYLPRVYEWSTERPDPFVRMDYVGYPSLSDLQLYGSHGKHIWNGVFHRLFTMLEEFAEFTVNAESDAISAALEEMYVHKTRQRMEWLRDDGVFAPFFDEETVTVNGTTLPSAGRVIRNLRELVEAEELLTRESLSIIHGDLCFPNVFYDPRNEIIKLVDPRGAFGEFTIYGDPLYDLAKLRHSAVGHYEHLINGQFTADINPETPSVEYEIFLTDAQFQREQRFDTLLESKTASSIETVKRIEALLWLSMVPLHDDSTERQACMLAQGLEKIAPYLEHRG